MYRYRYRMRVIVLSLGVVLGYGSAALHLLHHHGDYRFDRHGFGHACTDWPWSPDPAPNGAPAPKHVQ